MRVRVRRPEHTAVLVLALVGLISDALMKGPIQITSAQTIAGSWSYTGNLNTPRYGYTATLLPNGNVLVAGGRSADRPLASVELYDPSTGRWSFTGSLNVSREAHTATLLGNGKVLVAGGWANNCCQGSDLTNTAELYDPATGEWSFTGSLNVLRTGHTATLLSNGKVLFAGNGQGGANTELYDPATGKWSLSGNLSKTRVGHAATLLHDGRVLVAGGCEDDACLFYLGSTEVFDPNTEIWSITGGLNTQRDGHTLTPLQNGNVLMSGGGAQGFPFVLDTAELYNPATGRWSYTGTLLKRRWAGTVTLLRNGQVLVAGGAFSFDSARPGHTEIFNSAELYDPATGKWTTTGSLNTARFGHTATLLSDGKVLVVGGGSGSAELYDPETLDPAPTDPRIIMASVSGKKLFLTGENFHAGAVILLNGEEQKSKNDAQSPQTILIGKKAGKRVKEGDRLQVRNPNGSISAEFTFQGGLADSL